MGPCVLCYEGLPTQWDKRWGRGGATDWRKGKEEKAKLRVQWILWARALPITYTRDKTSCQVHLTFSWKVSKEPSTPKLPFCQSKNSDLNGKIRQKVSRLIGDPIHCVCLQSREVQKNMSSEPNFLMSVQTHITRFTALARLKSHQSFSSAARLQILKVHCVSGASCFCSVHPAQWPTMQTAKVAVEQKQETSFTQPYF